MFTARGVVKGQAAQRVALALGAVFPVVQGDNEDERGDGAVGLAFEGIAVGELPGGGDAVGSGQGRAGPRQRFAGQGARARPAGRGSLLLAVSLGDAGQRGQRRHRLEGRQRVGAATVGQCGLQVFLGGVVVTQRQVEIADVDAQAAVTGLEPDQLPRRRAFLVDGLQAAQAGADGLVEVPHAGVQPHELLQGGAGQLGRPCLGGALEQVRGLGQQARLELLLGPEEQLARIDACTRFGAHLREHQARRCEQEAKAGLHCIPHHTITA